MLTGVKPAPPKSFAANPRPRTLCHPVSFLPQPSGAENMHVRCSFWQSLPARPGAKARGPGELRCQGRGRWPSRVLSASRRRSLEPISDRNAGAAARWRVMCMLHPEKRALRETKSVKPQVTRSGAARNVHPRSPESLEHAHNSPSRGKILERAAKQAHRAGTAREALRDRTLPWHKRVARSRSKQGTGKLIDSAKPRGSQPLRRRHARCTQSTCGVLAIASRPITTFRAQAHRRRSARSSRMVKQKCRPYRPYMVSSTRNSPPRKGPWTKNEFLGLDQK